MEKITLEKIKKMSYTDFVGLINQWNVLPGAFNTLSKWKIFSNLNKNSNILEIACTTGFSSRELAIMSKCSGKAFDISQNSINAAIENKKIYAPNIKKTMGHSTLKGGVCYSPLFLGCSKIKTTKIPYLKR